jgi:hypothetical protein
MAMDLFSNVRDDSRGISLYTVLGWGGGAIVGSGDDRGPWEPPEAFWDVGRAVTPRVMQACHPAQRCQRDGRVLAKLIHRSGERVFRSTSSK